jgi:hypothetical protein
MIRAIGNGDPRWAVAPQLLPEEMPTTSEQRLPSTGVGTELTRFNALKHGILSRYTVMNGRRHSRAHAIPRTNAASSRWVLFRFSKHIVSTPRLSTSTVHPAAGRSPPACSFTAR